MSLIGRRILIHCTTREVQSVNFSVCIWFISWAERAPYFIHFPGTFKMCFWSHEFIVYKSCPIISVKIVASLWLAWDCEGWVSRLIPSPGWCSGVLQLFLLPASCCQSCHSKIQTWASPFHSIAETPSVALPCPRLPWRAEPLLQPGPLPSAAPSPDPFPHAVQMFRLIWDLLGGLPCETSPGLTVHYPSLSVPAALREPVYLSVFPISSPRVETVVHLSFLPFPGLDF